MVVRSIPRKSERREKLSYALQINALNGGVGMSIITGMSDQFKTQIQSDITRGRSKNDYIRLINDTFVVKKSCWDLIVAKLDSLLSYITNGSWSVSEKTVLIHEMDAFKTKLIETLNKYPDRLIEPEIITSAIDRDIFCFVMKNISTKSLSPDVALCLKSKNGAYPVIQLNSADGLLAEFPSNISVSEDLQFQDYDPNKAKHISQKLSQLLCSLALLHEQIYAWDHSLYNELLSDLRKNTDAATVNAFTSLADKYVADLKFNIAATLNELQEYLRESVNGVTNPINLDLRNKIKNYKDKESLWFDSIRPWVTTAVSSNLSEMPKGMKGNIYTFLDVA